MLTKVAMVSRTVLTTASDDESFKRLPPATRQTSFLGLAFVEASARQGHPICARLRWPCRGRPWRRSWAGCRKRSVGIPRSELTFCRFMSVGNHFVFLDRVAPPRWWCRVAPLMRHSSPQGLSRHALCRWSQLLLHEQMQIA